MINKGVFKLNLDVIQFGSKFCHWKRHLLKPTFDHSYTLFLLTYPITLPLLVSLTPTKQHLKEPGQKLTPNLQMQGAKHYFWHL